MNTQIPIDKGNNVLHTFINFMVQHEKRPVSSVLRVESQRVAPRSIEQIGLFYCPSLALSGLNWLGDINRQGMLNNRGFSPRSGRLTDYTRRLVTWVMRLQASNRIEQPVLRNVVLIRRLRLMLKVKLQMALKDD